MAAEFGPIQTSLEPPAANLSRRTNQEGFSILISEFPVVPTAFRVSFEPNTRTAHSIIPEVRTFGWARDRGQFTQSSIIVETTSEMTDRAHARALTQPTIPGRLVYECRDTLPQAPEAYAAFRDGIFPDLLDHGYIPVLGELSVVDNGQLAVVSFAEKKNMFYDSSGVAHLDTSYDPSDSAHRYVDWEPARLTRLRFPGHNGDIPRGRLTEWFEALPAAAA